MATEFNAPANIENQIRATISEKEEYEKQLRSISFSTVIKKNIWIIFTFLLMYIFPPLLLAPIPAYFIGKSLYKNSLTNKISECDQRIQNLRGISNEKTKSYSDQYLKSEKVEVIINWMVPLFLHKIGSADRSPHIKEILVPFSFTVNQDGISCDSGLFSFITNRYQLLQSSIEQSSMADAVSRRLVYKLNESVQKDSSGTDATFSISSISSNYVYLQYSALNGNYIPPLTF